MSLYVDGCSYAAGFGLDKSFSLGSLLNANYDASYSGKSNQSIFHDVYSNLHKFDRFVISLTYPLRFQIFDAGVRIPVLPSENGVAHRLKDTEYEKPYINFHKILYSLIDENFYETLSDAIAESIITLFKHHNKKYLIYSWAGRENYLSSEIIFLSPFPSEEFRLPDGRHLNEKGMVNWAEDIRKRFYDQ